MPRVADPQVRSALIDEAAKILAAEGPAALTTRRLTAAVDASTTAVYTHFGGMPELRRAIRREGFSRFAAQLAQVERHPHALLELLETGLAYMRNAFANPDLYRVMFMEAPLDAEDAETGWDTFERLVAAVQRCMDEGVFPNCDDANWGAMQYWTAGHGAISLALTGLVSREDAERLLVDVGTALATRFGA